MESACLLNTVSIFEKKHPQVAVNKQRSIVTFM